MVKVSINCILIFFSLFTDAFSLEKRDYEFEILLIHKDPNQKIYVAVEKTGLSRNPLLGPPRDPTTSPKIGFSSVSLMVWLSHSSFLVAEFSL